MTRNEIQATVLSLNPLDRVMLDYRKPDGSQSVRFGIVESVHRNIVGLTLLTEGQYKRFSGQRIQDITIL